MSSKFFNKVSVFFEDDEIPFMKQVYEEVFHPSKLPILYAGSGADVEHALVLGRNLVFFDTHLPEDNISEIVSKIERIGRIKGEMRTIDPEKVLKTVVDFEIDGMDYKLTYYAEDATKIGMKQYPELKNGIYAYFVKVPFPKERRAKSLRDPEFFGKILDSIIVGGFYLERECPITFKTPPERIGFKRIASGKISALSIHKGARGNLYKKIRGVDNLQELIRQDYQDRVY